jgi:hypothetical protein
MGLILFEEGEAEPLIEGYGYRVSQDGRILQDSSTVDCDCCDEPLTVENLGAVLPGSRYLYCTDPTCLSDYVAEVLEA